MKRTPKNPEDLKERIRVLQDERRNRLVAPVFTREVQEVLADAFVSVTVMPPEDVEELRVVCTERVRLMPDSERCNFASLTELCTALRGGPAMGVSASLIVFSNGTDFGGALRMPFPVLLEYLAPLWLIFREEFFAVTGTGNSGIYAERAFFDVAGRSMPGGIIELQRW